jgi:hypothetical protein
MKKNNFRSGLSLKYLKSATRIAYTLGAVLMTAALVLSTGVVPVTAGSSAAPSQQGRLFCDLSAYPGEKIKVEGQSSPWTADVSPPRYFSAVGIKAGTECMAVFTADGSDACYRVSGIGTSSITVWDLVEGGTPDCPEVSHLEIVAVDPEPTNTPDSPTNTPTFTPTFTLTPTNTPTNTPEGPTNTPTHTPEGPTSTPTHTPTFTPTFTLTPTNTPTNTPTFTQTPTNTPTSTPEDPTGTPTDPPQVTPTGTPEDPTSTPTDPPQVTPTNTPEDPTGTPTDPPDVTPSITPEDPGGDPTTTPTPALTNTTTPVPTLPPPEDDSTELLIPVTGFEAPFTSADSEFKQDVYTRVSFNTGLFFFGLGMAFHGALLWKKRREPGES